MKTIFRNLLVKGDKIHSKYTLICDKICNEAQKYVDWTDLRWEYLSSDGLCFGIDGEYYLDDTYNNIINDMTLIPAETFFEKVSLKGSLTPREFFECRI